MPAPMGPCSWTATHTGHSAADLAEWNAYPANIKAIADDIAIRFLWGATGRQYDACSRTVRPIIACSHLSLQDLDGTADSITYMGNQEWLGYPAGSPCCMRVDPKTAVLEPPVNTVTQVMVDGVVVNPAAYRVDEATRLVRIDGNSWPLSQDLSKANNAVGAFTVTYTIGLTVPAVLLQGAGILALEIARGLSGGTCRLPSRATEIVRQGVSVSLTDPTWLLEHNLTGIPEVDYLIRAYNPSGQATPFRVLIPNYYPTVVGT